jgi:hypothetical protein
MNTCPKCGQEIKENIKQVIEAKTLEWGAVSDKEMNWENAKKWCEAQGKGWRLPTRVELIQAFDEGALPTSGKHFWSSTENYGNPANAWYVSLNYGYTFYNTKVTLNCVRCVRP